MIEAREEQVSGPDATYQYTSSRMVTDGNASMQYGRVDVRARMPVGQGLWPAVWMLPEGNWTWPDDGEIDIVEYLGHQPSTVHGTVHGPGFSGADGIGTSYRLANGTFDDSFHVFSIVWDPDRIQWYVDGTQFHEVTRREVEAAGNEWPFDDRAFHVVANVAVGGVWGGYPDETTAFPQQMEIDYVRFYEESEGKGPSPVGSNANAPTDPDDDDLFEDVNGNGDQDFDDVVDLFNNRNSDADVDPQWFDFSGNGGMDFADIVDLYQENTG